MKARLLILSFFSHLVVIGQSNNEFEGIIKYTNHFQFTAEGVDTSQVKKDMGVSSIFYYKDGNYKWIIHSVPQRIEYFDEKTQTAYFLLPGKDTLLRSVVNGYDDSLISLNLSGIKQTVCGIPCWFAETYTITKGKSPEYAIKRAIFYSDKVPIQQGRFHSYKTYCLNKVIEQTKSWPVRIQLESEVFPFILTMEATEIIPNKISDSLVKMPDFPIRNIR